MFGKAPLQNGLIERVLDDAWSLRVNRVEYATLGYGSYHWLATSSDLWLVTADRDDARPIRAAYRLAYALADGGLSFVRPPLRHRRDGVVWQHDGWLISVWPWLDGRTGSGLVHEPADLAAVLRCVRQLHDHSAVDRVPNLVEDWRIPAREQLIELLGLPADQWPSRSFADEVRSRLGENENRLGAMFARYDQLAAEIGSRDSEYVITHGEPHAGNVVHVDAGVKLIDWDTVRWAPRERDLWSLTDQPGWRHAYGDDVSISQEALEVYRLQWELVEIADFAWSLAFTDETNADIEVAIRELRKYLPV